MPSKQHSIDKKHSSEIALENSELRKKLWEVSTQLIEIERLFNELYSLCIKKTSKK